MWCGSQLKEHSESVGRPVLLMPIKQVSYGKGMCLCLLCCVTNYTNLATSNTYLASHSFCMSEFCSQFSSVSVGVSQDGIKLCSSLRLGELFHAHVGNIQLLSAADLRVSVFPRVLSCLHSWFCLFVVPFVSFFFFFCHIGFPNMATSNKQRVFLKSLTVSYNVM